MGELIVRDDGQLRRVERAIRAFEARSVCDQMRMQSLLVALQAERAMLLGTRQAGRYPVLLRGDQASQAATSSQAL